VTLRFNPGNFLAGIPNVPPVLEEIFDLDCPSDDEVSVVISPQSGQSFYRTTDSIFNQRFRARLFVFQANSAGTYMVMLSNISGFSPFITASRNFATSWQETGDMLVFDVAADQTGPITVEVTTEFPMTYGSFDIHLQCEMGILAYWSFDDPEIDPQAAWADSLVDHPLGVFTGPFGTTVPGKVNNAGNFFSQPGGFGNPTFAKADFVDPPESPSGFTVAGWFNADFTRGVNYASLGVNGGGFIAGDGFTLTLSEAVLGPPATVQVVLFMDSGSIAEGSTPVALTPSVWHFFVMWWDSSDELFRIQFDNGTIYTLTNTWNETVNDCFVQMSGPFSGVPKTRQADETGFWAKALSPSERSDLWNSGNGVTWPDVPM
jgi:hypothetical protein